MKKLFTILSFALLLVTSCTRFDDSAIWEELLNHKDRIEKLEADCNRLNSSVEALRVILEALQVNDYVTDVTKIIEGGVEVGYSITFAKRGEVTIYHGTNSGTPKISIRKANDGQYYWTVDGEWIRSWHLVPTLRFQTSSLKNCEGLHFSCFKPSSLWLFVTAALGK